MLRTRCPFAALACALACTTPTVSPDAGHAPDAAPPDDTGADAAPSPVVIETLTQDFGPLELASGEERTSDCVAWSLGNETPIWVNAVRFEATPGIHHSNWFHVRPTTFPGPDGVFNCRERDFDSVIAAAAGGVLFAQSTQTASENQAFPAGMALRLPADAVVVADLHLLNTTPEDLRVDIHMELDLIAEEAVTTRLQGMAFDYVDLQLPPRMQSEFSMDCDFARSLGGPIDFRIYYTLPHYHELGVGMRLELIGGERDGEVLWESFSPIGEPWGQTFDPPLDPRGATGLRVTCVYDNPRDEVVRYGIGDQEMCLMLAFTDSRYVWAGGNLERGVNEEVAVSGGVSSNEAPCQIYAVPGR